MHPVVKVAVGAVLVLLLGGILAIAATLRLPAERYRFLEGREPDHTGVYSGYSVRPWFEGRVYTWQGDYRAVTAAARAELEDQGFKETRSGIKDAVSFEAGRVVQVYIEVGRAENPMGKTDKDPNWVTVTTTRPAPESWMTHIRLGLTPSE